MKQNPVKRGIALVLIAALLAALLAACGKQETAAPYEYDASSYALNTRIEGMTFLVPRSLDDGKEDAANYHLYDEDDLSKHAFEWLNDDGLGYGLYQPGNYACYAYSLGGYNHISGIRDVSYLPWKLGFSDRLSFTAREGEEFYTHADHKTGDIRNRFPAVIYDEVTGLSWEGYVTLLEDFETGLIYLFADGYADSGKEAQAKYLADHAVITLN